MRPRSDTLLVWTGAPCTYGCSTCPIDPAAAPAGLSVIDLQRSLAALPTGEERLAVLVGGEPFLRPDCLRLIAAIRASGYQPGIVTTGRPLVYPQLRERLRRAGLAYLRVQFFGVGEAHDRAAAVPGAFEQALTGLRAWIAEGGAGCDVDVALSTRSLPFESIVSGVETLAREIRSPDVQIVVALAASTRAALQDSASLPPAFAALAHWNEGTTRPLLVWEGLPEFAVPAPHLTIAPPRPTFVATAPAACCLGAVEDPATAFAADGETTRANSFNFVRTTTSVPWTADADACTAYQAADGAALSRHLWLVDEDRLVLYVTDTADFEPAEVGRIKDELSHLFVDRAPAGVLDDFTEGMRRVLPDATCDACANRARCGRRFQVVDGAPFVREETWIGNYIADLRGRVLDVGCGEQLYRDRLAPLVSMGAVHYTGLDPDEPSLAALQAILPAGLFHIGGIEQFQGQPASYDHILCLRSLNHVVDLDAALARMAALLKPGGSLLIVETTPFALLRRPEQVAAADRAPRAGHQHFRNLDSHEVLPLARRHALQVIEHHAASLPTTNEWILLLRRAGAATA